MEEKDNIVELIDEEGNALSFEYIMTIDYDQNEYVVLSPMESTNHSSQELVGNEVVILRVEQDSNQEDIYVSIEDEEELEDVFHAFSEITAD